MDRDSITCYLAIAAVLVSAGCFAVVLLVADRVLG